MSDGMYTECVSRKYGLGVGVGVCDIVSRVNRLSILMIPSPL